MEIVKNTLLNVLPEGNLLNCRKGVNVEFSFFFLTTIYPPSYKIRLILLWVYRKID